MPFLGAYLPIFAHPSCPFFAPVPIIMSTAKTTTMYSLPSIQESFGKMDLPTNMYKLPPIQGDPVDQHENNDPVIKELNNSSLPY